jgi:hypothetical protein
MAGNVGGVQASAVENDDFTRASLQGLTGVYVSVQPPDIVYGENALTTDTIKADTVLALKSAGIPVLSHQQWADTKGGPVCYVDVDIIHDIVMNDILNANMYAYVITVELNQDVLLLREPTIQTLSPTWSISYLGVTNALPRIREKIQELIDQFIEAYLAVNSGTPVADKLDSELDQAPDSEIDSESSAELQSDSKSESKGTAPETKKEIIHRLTIDEAAQPHGGPAQMEKEPKQGGEENSSTRQ